MNGEERATRDRGESQRPVDQEQTSGESPTESSEPSAASPTAEKEAAADTAPAEDDQSSVAPEEEPTDVDKRSGSPKKAPRKRRKRKVRGDAAELRLRGRRAICKRIAAIAPQMLKTVKLRVLGRYLESTRGLGDADLTNCITKDVSKIVSKSRVLDAINTADPDVDRRNLKSIIVFGVLLQEETHSLDEHRLDEKVLEFEKSIVKRAKSLDFFDDKKHDQMRWHHYDTYRIVLDAAWRSEADISADEAVLLAVLRDHLSISLEEHWLIGAFLKRFPKPKCHLHTPDEINEARKELQREAILWSYRDDNNRTIDAIPHEVVSVIRKHVAKQELQRVNYRRILHHDYILLTDLREILVSRNMDRYGNKEELIERVVNSDIQPSEVLSALDRQKLSDMCRYVQLKHSGNKPKLIERLIEFYDDLTFEERVTKDDREEWFNNYELLASRSYSKLKAKKLITKDLEIEHQFEQATDFLFEVVLNVRIDNRRKISKADGRILLDSHEVILWDCKSVEGAVNLQDHLDSQFDLYIRKEREKGNQPLVFLVIGPAFTPNSIKLAHQYKARTNCDVALVTAEALKELADKWEATEPEKKAFPVRLFNRTEVIDKDRVAFLLSLA